MNVIFITFQFVLSNSHQVSISNMQEKMFKNEFVSNWDHLWHLKCFIMLHHLFFVLDLQAQKECTALLVKLNLTMFIWSWANGGDIWSVIWSIYFLLFGRVDAYKGFNCMLASFPVFGTRRSTLVVIFQSEKFNYANGSEHFRVL